MGTFGQVRECISLETKETYAVKIIDQRNRSQSWGVKSVARQEADLLGSLGMMIHEFLVHATFRSPSHYPFH